MNGSHFAIFLAANLSCFVAGLALGVSITIWKIERRGKR